MAGIGFELKKLFSQKGIFAILRAYGYAGIVSSGPMLLGILLIFGIHALAVVGGAGEHMQNLLTAVTMLSRASTSPSQTVKSPTKLW